MKTHHTTPIWPAIAMAFTLAATAGETNKNSPDLSRERVLYEIGYSHLDTQWRWAYPQVIREYIPDTVRSNAPL